MAESIHIPNFKNKREIYEHLIPQLKALIAGESDLIANMANLASGLKMALDFLWVGFYLVKNEELVLGPFQGPVACTRIKKGMGVCGTAWIKKESIIVPDVDKFPGHIVCSSESKSEIVIPGIIDNRVIFILDVDSISLNDFDEIDLEYLSIVVNELTLTIKGENNSTL